MAELRIEQLPEALTVALADLVPLAAYDEQIQTGYKAKHIGAAELAAAILNSFSQSTLSTTDKTIVGALNEIVTSLSSVPEVLTGTGDPSSAQGTDKDFYVKYATSGGVTSVTGLFVKLSGAWVSIATGGGAGAFYITMTQSGSSFVVDKTKDEIDGAYADGQALVVIFNVTPKRYFYLAEYKDSTSYKDYYFSYQMGQGAIDFCLTTHSGGVTIQLFHNTPLAQIDNTATETNSVWSSSKTHAEDLATLSSAEEYTDTSIYDILPTETASGSVANFTTSLALPLVECKAQIVATQSGTGDPSPSNVRPISGWTACTISHSGADTSDPTEYEIDLDGTVYGGELDVKRGVLKVTWAKVDLNSFTWNKDSNQSNPNGTYYTAAGDFSAFANYDTIKSNVGVAGNGNIPTSPANSFWFNGVRTGIRWIWGSPQGGSSLSDLETFLQNNTCYLIAELVTPIEVSLTPEEITTLAGVNNIWADTGDISVDFKVSIKEYIDNKLASLGTRSASLTKAASPEGEKIENNETEGGENER